MPAEYIKGKLPDLLDFPKLKSTLHKVFLDVMKLWPSDTIRISFPLKPSITTNSREIFIPIRGVEGIASYEVFPLIEKINDLWIYDPQRLNKVVAYIVRVGTQEDIEDYLHIQVHDRTVRKSEFNSTAKNLKGE